ncbi:MAG: peptidoglycan DD-metalloendopeptidase family protein [Actinomycetota bacterium]|nr:peptidoglycan DD-metalloendopeptidase family protein [Actinomycetota bacterium]
MPSRPVRAVVVAGLALCVAGGALSPAQADREDWLEERQQAIGKQIYGQRHELEETSERLQAATAVLRSAQVRLATARDELAQTLGQLAAAEQLDRQMRLALAEAEQRLAEAEAELAAAQSEVTETQDEIEQFAVQAYTSGDPGLMSVDAVINGDSSETFPMMMSSAESVVSAQTAALDDLDAERILVTLHEEQVQKIRNEVAVKRQEAADNLERKQDLARSAREKRRAVNALVDERRDAAQEARRAKQQDLRILQKMERERDRVADLLTNLRMAGLGSTTATGSGFLSYPVPGAYITSPYGMRMHPILGYVKLHDGTDFAAGCGTPVLAPANGRVVAQYYNAGYGNRVIIAHGVVNGRPLATAINHLSAYSTSQGERVTRGEVIGYVGTTGYSTGCHLHFMVLENGQTVNPAGWL